MKRSIGRWMSVAVMVGFGSSLGVADAQTSTGENGGQGTVVRNQRTSTLSGADQLREADQILTAMNSLRLRVSNMLDRARQDRDIVKVNCIDDKLTQIDLAVRSARDHKDLLQTAVGINNDGQRNHEFTLLTVFRSRAEGLEGEARQCIGEDTGTFDRGTIVTMRVSPGLPATDTTLVVEGSNLPDRPLVPSPVM